MKKNAHFLVRSALIGCLALGGILMEASPLEAQTRSANVTQPAASTSDGVVNINTASVAELQHLPGIGSTKAQAIVELRDRVQRFRRVEDILHVPGIGRRTFRRLRSLLTLTGATTLGTPQ